MKLKLYGEHTLNSQGEFLCPTCEYSSTVKTARETIITCGVFRRTIRDRVLECSRYDDNRIKGPGQHDIIAWHYYPESNRFLSPRQRMELENGSLQVTVVPVNTEEKENVH